MTSSRASSSADMLSLDSSRDLTSTSSVTDDVKSDVVAANTQSVDTLSGFDECNMESLTETDRQNTSCVSIITHSSRYSAFVSPMNHSLLQMLWTHHFCKEYLHIPSARPQAAKWYHTLTLINVRITRLALSTCLVTESKMFIHQKYSRSSANAERPCQHNVS